MIAINRPSQDITGEQPVFDPGTLVQHRRYGYRGVVVEREESCQAGDDWYLKNQTQPVRAQPWYHVLVSESSSCTYAAATSLQADTTGQPISHPLVSHFFSAFQDGRYVRNDRPWPQ